jgi:hypothetical protein
MVPVFGMFLRIRLSMVPTIGINNYFLKPGKIERKITISYLVTGLAREPEGAELSAPGTAMFSINYNFLPCYGTGEGA